MLALRKWKTINLALVGIAMVWSAKTLVADAGIHATLAAGIGEVDMKFSGEGMPAGVFKLVSASGGNIHVERGTDNVLANAFLAQGYFPAADIPGEQWLKKYTEDGTSCARFVSADDDPQSKKVTITPGLQPGCSDINLFPSSYEALLGEPDPATGMVELSNPLFANLETNMKNTYEGLFYQAQGFGQRPGPFANMFSFNLGGVLTRFSEDSPPQLIWLGEKDFTITHSPRSFTSSAELKLKVDIPLIGS